MTMNSAFLVADQLTYNGCAASHSSSSSLFESELVGMVLLDRHLRLSCKLLLRATLPAIDLKVASLARLPNECRPD